MHTYQHKCIGVGMEWAPCTHMFTPIIVTLQNPFYNQSRSGRRFIDLFIPAAAAAAHACYSVCLKESPSINTTIYLISGVYRD